MGQEVEEKLAREREADTLSWLGASVQLTQEIRSFQGLPVYPFRIHLEKLTQ